MSDYTITAEENPDPDEARVINRILGAYNIRQIGADDYRPVLLLLRDAGGEVVGGLRGETYWNWLYVDLLAISDEARGLGCGSRLLEMAEREALDRGCHHAYLDTFSFQALPFYEKQGYTVFGTLDHYPEEHKRYFLLKELRSR